MNPVLEALEAREKLAVRNRQSVKGYSRVRKGKVEQVRPHTREEEEESPEAKKAKALRAKKEAEIRLWRTWMEGGQKPEDLRPLLKSMMPLIQSRAREYKGTGLRISPASVDAEFYKQALEAFKHYDPTRGTLGTYLYKYLDKTKRFIAQNQNVARIPENRVFKIHKFRLAEEQLAQELGRPAKDIELAGYMGWPVKEVVRMSKEIRRDLWRHGFEDDPEARTPTKESEILKLIRYELNDSEKKVYDLLVGQGVESTSEISKRLGFNNYKVSRIKARIAKKMERYS